LLNRNDELFQPACLELFFECVLKHGLTFGLPEKGERNVGGRKMIKQA
jgi:hypothetical protein